MDCFDPFVETRNGGIRDGMRRSRDGFDERKKERGKESGGREGGIYGTSLNEAARCRWLKGFRGGREGAETEEKVETCDPARKYTRGCGVVKDEYSGFDTRGNLSSPVETALFVFQ